MDIAMALGRKHTPIVSHTTKVNIRMEISMAFGNSTTPMDNL